MSAVSDQSSASKPIPQNQVIRDFKSGTNDVSLGYVIERITFQMQDQLDVLCSLLPEYDNYQKTVEILKFTKSSWYLSVKLLAILKWILKSQKISHLFTVESFINNSQSYFIETADNLSVIAREYLFDAKLPPYQVNLAMELMLSHKSSYLPSCIKSDIFKNAEVSNYSDEKIIAILEDEILLKLAQEIRPNSDLQIDSLKGGAVTLILPKKFKVTLTLVKIKKQYVWKTKGLNFLLKLPVWIQTSDAIHPIQLSYIKTFIEANMLKVSQKNKSPLDFLENYLTDFANSFIIELISLHMKKKTMVYGCKTMNIIEFEQSESITIGYWKSKEASDDFSNKIKIRNTENSLNIECVRSFTDDLQINDIFDYVDSITYNFDFDALLNKVLRQTITQSMIKLKDSLNGFETELIETESFTYIKLYFNQNIPPLFIHRNFYSGSWILDHTYKHNMYCKNLLENMMQSIENDSDIEKSLSALANEIVLIYTIMPTSSHNFRILPSLDINENAGSENKQEFRKHLHSKCYIQFVLNDSYFLQVSVFYRDNKFWVNVYLYFIAPVEKDQDQNNSNQSNSISPIYNPKALRVLKNPKIRLKTDIPSLRVQKILPIRDQHEFSATVPNEIFNLLRNFDIKQALRDISDDILKSGSLHTGITTRTFMDIISLHNIPFYPTLKQYFNIKCFKIFLDHERNGQNVFFEASINFDLPGGITFSNHDKKNTKCNYKYLNLSASTIDINLIKMITIAQLLTNSPLNKFEGIKITFSYLSLSLFFEKYNAEFLITYNPMSKKFLVLGNDEPANNPINFSKNQLFSQYLTILQHYLNESKDLNQTIVYLQNFLSFYGLLNKFDGGLAYANTSNKNIFVPVMDSRITFNSPYEFDVYILYSSKLSMQIISENSVGIKDYFEKIDPSDESPEYSLKYIPIDQFLKLVPSIKYKIRDCISIQKESLQRLLQPISTTGCGSIMPFLTAYSICYQLLVQLYSNLKSEDFNNIILDKNSIRFSKKNFRLKISIILNLPELNFDLEVHSLNIPELSEFFADLDFTFLREYFIQNVAHPPFKPFVFIAFCRLFKLPSRVLRDMLLILKESMSLTQRTVPGICLTVPFGSFLNMLSAGSISVVVMRNKGFLMLSVKNRNEKLEVLSDFYMPIIYDFEKSTVKIVDQALKENQDFDQIQRLFNSYTDQVSSTNGILYQCAKITMDFLNK